LYITGPIFLNYKVNLNIQDGDWDQDGNNRLGKTSYRGKEEHEKKLWRSCGNTHTDGEARLSDDPHRVETLRKKKNKVNLHAFMMTIVNHFWLG
jgi:hypothetical protein